MQRLKAKEAFETCLKRNALGLKTFPVASIARSTQLALHAQYLFRVCLVGWGPCVDLGGWARDLIS